jgi:hypothetical protein
MLARIEIIEQTLGVQRPAGARDGNKYFHANARQYGRAREVEQAPLNVGQASCLSPYFFVRVLRGSWFQGVLPADTHLQSLLQFNPEIARAKRFL